MTWVLEPQLDNNKHEAGIGGLRVGWLSQRDARGNVMRYPGSDREMRVLVDWQHGLLLCHYLNGDYGHLPGQNTWSEADERNSYLDAERIPRSG